MRKNFFLHFLNRDSREIFGLFKFQETNAHYRILRRVLNVAAILCEDECILPPGFVLEDDIAFNLAEAQTEYLRASLLRFPLREANLADYAEKKRVEYHPMRDRYSGLFNDTRLEFLGRNAKGLIGRKTHISEEILRGWREGAETNKRPWMPVKKLLTSKELAHVEQIPGHLADDGVALTWSAISPKLEESARVAASPLRNALQHTYFSQYCAEFDLITLAYIPYAVEQFYLPRLPKIYSYALFAKFLNAFDVDNFFLDASASVILDLRGREGLIAFADAYVGLAAQCASATDLVFKARHAATTTGYDWGSIKRRFNPLVSTPDVLELLELDHALAAAAATLSKEYGLERRMDKIPLMAAAAEKIRLGAKPMAEIVLFVALNEELHELAGPLGLTINSTAPAANGQIGGVAVDVLCPRNMGRVEAAIEVTRYLESRRAKPPKLIIVTGLAGGFPEANTSPGHLICGTAVVDLAQRKIIDDAEKETQTKFRRRDYDLNPRLRDLLLSDAFNTKEWVAKSIDVADWPDDRRPSLHDGLIASVDEVIASDEWRKKILAHTDKLLGVEMEAGGVCAAARSYGVAVSLIRCVSDNADPAKADDSWRKRGMRTIAQLLLYLPVDELLKNIAS